MDKAKADELHEAILKALGEVESEYGIKFKIQGGMFTDSNVIFKLQAAEVQQDGTVKDRIATDFEQLAHRFGFKPSDLYREVKMLGRTYKIIGLKPQCWKYPVILERDDGKQFRFPVSGILMRMKTEAAIRA